ncbi:unnamed protein product [Diabrotica balteata]|uniref:Uncharacterized protein n=1 Tax=Diabrotica balteata TaxID=107213 RepID=A0A9N9SZ87_DIABA|nr:unnamed protein product [Diabrotica balteata]
MKPSDTSRDSPSQDKSHSPICMPDIPLPTPPPMANIMMTSRFDLQTRGGCGYRRILSSRSTEFRSPLLGRSSFAQIQETRSPLMPVRKVSSISEKLALSPLPRHRNFEDLSKNVDERFNLSLSDLCFQRSKYLSRDSVLSEEMEEVQMVSRELSSKFNQPSTENISPEYQSVFFNDHYISDIDENEEIKEFICGYKTPERRLSDNSEKTYKSFERTFSCNTLPSLSSLRTNKKVSGPVNSFGSTSSMKSSDYLCSPLAVRKIDQFDQRSVFKSPQRTIVKIAKVSNGKAQGSRLLKP